MQTAKTLSRLGGCPGLSESSLGAHSFCWFCHAVALIRTIKQQYLRLTLLYVYKVNVPQWVNHAAFKRLVLVLWLPPILPKVDTHCVWMTKGLFCHERHIVKPWKQNTELLSAANTITYSLTLTLTIRVHYKIVCLSVLFCLTCQSTTMVMSRRSVNLSTLFLGKLRLKRLTSI